MNDQLITIDEDSLDLVAGGAAFSFAPFGFINDIGKAIQDLANFKITGEATFTINGIKFL